MNALPEAGARAAPRSTTTNELIKNDLRVYGDQGEKDAVLHRFVICSVSVELLSATVVGLAMADEGAGSGRTGVIEIEISTSSVCNLTGVGSGMGPVLMPCDRPNAFRWEGLLSLCLDWMGGNLDSHRCE